MALTDLYVRERRTGRVFRVGDDPHDMLRIENGWLHYENLQNGDGCVLGVDHDACGYEFVDNTDENGFNADPRYAQKEEKTAVYDGYLYFSTNEDTVNKAANNLERAFRAAGMNSIGYNLMYTLRPEERELMVAGTFCITPFHGDDAFRKACEKQGINTDNLVRRKVVYSGYMYFSTNEDTVKKAIVNFNKAFKKTGMNISAWQFHYTLRPEDAELLVEGWFSVRPFIGDDAFRRACEKQGINVDNLVRKEK